MKTAMLFAVGLLGMGAFVLWGCGHKVVVVERHEPAQVVYVQDPPPATVIIDDRGSRPSRTCVWIDGYWGWDNDHRKHEWVRGRWQEPPRHGAVWESHHWEHERDGYRLQEGHWR